MRAVAVGPDELEQVALFHGLAQPELTRIAELLHCEWYPRGRQIMARDQPGDMVCVILGGAVKVMMEREDGGRVILAILTAGEVVGEMSAVDHLRRSAKVVAQEDSTLLWIDRAAFLACLRSIPEMSLNLAGILSRRLRVADARIEMLATEDVAGRLARQLLVLAAEYGRQGFEGGTLIPFRLTQTDLAALVGCSRVRLNHVLVVWKARDYVRVDEDYRVTIVRQDALARFART